MINRLITIFNNNFVLIKDNFTLFITFFIANLLALIFHFYMGRVLGPSDYGTLGTLISLVYLFNVFVLAIQNSITKFVSDLKVKNEYNKIAYLLIRSLRKLFIIGVLIIILFIIFTPLIANFLHIQTLPLILVSFFIIFAGLIPVTRGILQGLQKFFSYGSNYVLEMLLRLGIGFILILMGLTVNAGVLALVLSTLFAFVLSLIPLRKFLFMKKEKFSTSKIYTYSFPVGFTLLVLTSLYTVDLILVKHFFDAFNAGLYAAIALLGKAIFFGTFSIGQVMFAKSSELYYENKHSKHILYKSLFFVLVASVPLILLYYIFPNFIINLLYGSNYLLASNLLWFYSLVILLFTLTYTISLYGLAIGKIRFIYLLVLFNILEIVLIWIFHNTLLQVITVLFYLLLILLIILFFAILIVKDARPNISNTSI